MAVFEFKSLGKALAIGSAVLLTATPVVVIADASNPMYMPKKKKPQAKKRAETKARTQTKPKAQAKPMAKPAPKAPVNDFVPSYAPPTPAPAPVAAPAPTYVPAPAPVAAAPAPVAAPATTAPVAKAGGKNWLVGLLAVAGLVGGGILVADALDEDEPTSP